MISLLLSACVCCFFFFLDFSDDAENGGSDIVRLGGLTMDKREIACLFLFAFVLVGACVGLAGSIPCTVGIGWDGYVVRGLIAFGLDPMLFAAGIYG